MLASYRVRSGLLLLHAKERRAGRSRADTWLHLLIPFYPHQLWAKGSGKYIMTRIDIWVSQFPDDKDRYGSRNIGLITKKILLNSVTMEA